MDCGSFALLGAKSPVNQQEYGSIHGFTGRSYHSMMDDLRILLLLISQNRLERIGFILVENWNLPLM